MIESRRVRRMAGVCFGLASRRSGWTTGGSRECRFPGPRVWDRRALNIVVASLALVLAAPVAFGVAELLRWHLPAPFSFGWLRTGELLHDTLWLSGSARVWGSHGLTFVLGALGGLAADVYRARVAARAGRPARCHR